MRNSFKDQTKRAGIALAAVVTFAALVPNAALADNPHFIRASVVIDSDGNLLCSWKEAGLGTNQQITYSCGAEAVGVLERCFTKKDNQPQAANKVSTFRDLDNEDTFNSGQNGQIVASLTTEVPTAVRFCPRGQVQKIVAVRWCNASLVDVTNNIVGATATELFHEFISGAGTVPPCSELLVP